MSSSFQGYVDERSTRHVAGWVRDLSDPAARVAFEIVLDGEDGRVLHRGVADTHSEVLAQLGVGDGLYAFRAPLDPPLSAAERDRVFVRPLDSARRLELAPGLRTEFTEPANSFQGYVDERSTHHVAGWLRDLSDPAARVAFEIVLDGDDGPRVLHSGIADTPSQLLVKIGVGDGGHAFDVRLDPALTPAERDRVFVRAAGHARRLELAPALRTEFTPIGHLAMDIVDNCNLRCPFCVYDYAATHATHMMSDRTFDAALRLIPYIRDANFWLSCLHEATLHPRLIEFIERVPRAYRCKVNYTTNLAKRMPATYFECLAESGLHHLNVSLESLRPEVYERLRKGARHRIFMENWALMLDRFAKGKDPPRLRYNIMAYRSNLAEIPELVDTLRRDKRAWQIEVRHTYDVAHIPDEFRAREFLTTEEWAWLAQRLGHHDPEEVMLLLPPSGAGYMRARSTSAAPAAPVAPFGPDPGHGRVPRPLALQMHWDGMLVVYGENQPGQGHAKSTTNYLFTNINYLPDPIGFLMTL